MSIAAGESLLLPEAKHIQILAEALRIVGLRDIQYASDPLIALARYQFGFLPSPSFDFKRSVAALRTIRFITTRAAPVCF